jgi:hypothetical protein
MATQYQANVTITLLLRSNQTTVALAQSDMAAQAAQIANELHTAPRQHTYVGKVTVGAVPAPAVIQYFPT